MCIEFSENSLLSFVWSAESVVIFPVIPDISNLYLPFFSLYHICWRFETLLIIFQIISSFIDSLYCFLFSILLILKFPFIIFFLFLILGLFALSHFDLKVWARLLIWNFASFLTYEFNATNSLSAVLSLCPTYPTVEV